MSVFVPPPGLVGLSLSYALSITALLAGLIFNFTQTEMQLVSVERTEEYATGLPSEPQEQNSQVRWTVNGGSAACLYIRAAVAIPQGAALNHTAKKT